MINTLIFDIGGTKTRIAIIDPTTNSQIKSTSFDTPKNPKEAIIELSDIAFDLLGGPMNTIAVAAGGVAGTLDKDKHSLVHSTNLPEWVGFPLWSTLKKFTKSSVFLENDTALVGLGESSDGAGVNSDIMAYITISTGIGGVRIIDGFIDDSMYGFEPGHQILNHITGDTWEDLASGAAVAAKYGKPAKDVLEQEVWDQAMYIIAIGVYNTILYWSPDTIVLGGGIMNDIVHLSVGKIIQHLERLPQITPKLPSIVLADLKSDGGLYGARTLIRQNMKE